MNICHNHEKDGFVVVMEKDAPYRGGYGCPVCEVLHDNFRMRLDIMSNHGLADYSAAHLPKLVQRILTRMARAARKKQKPRTTRRKT